MEALNPYHEEKPWGDYEKFTENANSTVKILTINPGEAFSLQTHKDRDEFWRIISGEGVVTVGDKKEEAVTAGEFFVKRGEAHRLEASGEEPLVVLEISFGNFDEQDIVRIEDKYGRV